MEEIISLRAFVLLLIKQMVIKVKIDFSLHAYFISIYILIDYLTGWITNPLHILPYKFRKMSIVLSVVLLKL